MNQIHSFKACFEALLWHLSSSQYSKVKVALLLHAAFLDSLLNTPVVQYNPSSLAGWISMHSSSMGAPIIVQLTVTSELFSPVLCLTHFSFLSSSFRSLSLELSKTSLICFIFLKYCWMRQEDQEVVRFTSWFILSYHTPVLPVIHCLKRDRKLGQVPFTLS